MCEMTDSQFLLDLAKRLWNVPGMYGTDQCDIERLEKIARQTSVKQFTLHWLDGTKSTVTGTDIKDAFRAAGYGGGIVATLDHWEENDEEA